MWRSGFWDSAFVDDVFWALGVVKSVYVCMWEGKMVLCFYVLWKDDRDVSVF